MLTSEEIVLLRQYYSHVIAQLHPGISGVMIPNLADDTVEKMLSRWDHPTIPAPTAEAVEATFTTYVLPDIQATQAARSALKDRLEVSILLTSTPLEVASRVENRITTWTSLAEAKADLYTWLPVIGAAIAHLLTTGDDV